MKLLLLFPQVVHLVIQSPTGNKRSSEHLNPDLLAPEFLFVTKMMDALNKGNIRRIQLVYRTGENHFKRMDLGNKK